MIVGTLFALSFSEINLKNALWVGLVSFIGADTIYKLFEEKIFKTFSEIVENKKEEIDEEFLIK